MKVSQCFRSSETQATSDGCLVLRGVDLPARLSRWPDSDSELRSCVNREVRTVELTACFVTRDNKQRSDLKWMDTHAISVDLLLILSETSSDFVSQFQTGCIHYSKDDAIF